MYNMLFRSLTRTTIVLQIRVQKVEILQIMRGQLINIDTIYIDRPRVRVRLVRTKQFVTYGLNKTILQYAIENRNRAIGRSPTSETNNYEPVN